MEVGRRDMTVVVCVAVKILGLDFVELEVVEVVVP